MKTIAIIQARLGSTRLPHKVLMDIGGKTMIERVVERVQQSAKVDDIVIATTTEPADDLLVEFCRSKSWNCFAGSENDVLSRYIGAAQAFDADNVVRITSDCPLIDPSIVDRVVGLLEKNVDIDYACNFFPQRWYPRGLDCEALTRSTLRRIDLLATEKEYREHVTLFAYQNTEHFWLASNQAAQDYSGYRWTVDTEDDLTLVREIYKHFGESKFNWRDILDAYSRFPRWREINGSISQKTVPGVTKTNPVAEPVAKTAAKVG